MQTNGQPLGFIILCGEDLEPSKKDDLASEHFALACGKCGVMITLTWGQLAHAHARPRMENAPIFLSCQRCHDEFRDRMIAEGHLPPDFHGYEWDEDTAPRPSLSERIDLGRRTYRDLVSTWDQVWGPHLDRRHPLGKNLAKTRALCDSWGLASDDPWIGVAFMRLVLACMRSSEIPQIVADRIKHEYSLPA